MVAPFHCVVTCGIIQLRVGANQIALVDVNLDRKGHISNVKERSRAMRGGEREREFEMFYRFTSCCGVGIARTLPRH